MKGKRQLKMLELIEREPIETQEELQRKLCDSGFAVTQATVSRDIRELGLVKVSDGTGGYRYRADSARKSEAAGEKLARIFAEAARSCDFAGNLVVVHSYPGMGSAVGAAIDTMGMDGVIGTLAGDDTLLIVVRTEHAAQSICALLKTLIKAE